MLMEAESAAEANEWIAAMKLHCRFADAQAEDTVIDHLKKQADRWAIAIIMFR